MNLKNQKKFIALTFLSMLIAVMVLSNLNMAMSSNTETTSTESTDAVSQNTYMYLRMKGQKQGDINGGVTTKGQENSILVFSYSHSIVSPRDAASGLPTGKRQHKPFVITKELDKSTPLLYSALVQNENLPTWELQIWKTQPTGVLANVFTVKLTNANIAEISTRSSGYGTTETISFTYQKIEWTWVSGGITALDDWETPVV